MCQWPVRFSYLSIPAPPPRATSHAPPKHARLQGNERPRFGHGSVRRHEGTVGHTPEAVVLACLSCTSHDAIPRREEDVANGAVMTTRRVVPASPWSPSPEAEDPMCCVHGLAPVEENPAAVVEPLRIGCVVPTALVHLTYQPSHLFPLPSQASRLPVTPNLVSSVNGGE